MLPYCLTSKISEYRVGERMGLLEIAKSLEEVALSESYFVDRII